MKKLNLLLLLLLGCNLMVLAGKVEPYKGSRIFWDQSSRTTVFQSGGYPRIIQLQDDRLMACCESNGINIAFSTTKGASWSSPVKIVTNQNNVPECVPDLIQLTDGTIIVAYNPRPKEPYTEDRKFGIRCKRSTDNGKTWSDEIFVNDASYTFDNGCWEPSMLELPSGEVQLYFADEGPYMTNGDQQISMCRSFDGGKTWSAAQKVAYREGFRDGMPSATLLQDGKTIAIAFEDNGWGYGDFVPSIAVCPLATNWDDYWVSGSSSNRWRAVNYDLSPLAKGGAPYLRRLPWGETVLSHQSPYGDGNMQMWTYVGNAEAKDFKAMTAPFKLNDNDKALWTSLAVIDTGIVVAVAGINGKVEMEKGYAVRQLEVPYATPKVDGLMTRNEGYYRSNATQVMLGTQEGVRFNADYAYTEDSLYLISRVYDTTFTPKHNSRSDGVQFFFDADYASDSVPVSGMHRIFLRADTTVQYWRGDDEQQTWVSATLEGVNMKQTTYSSYYTVEAAIPWKSLGIKPEGGKLMRATVMLQDNRSSNRDVHQETLPDAKVSKSYTWMDLRLVPKEETNGIGRIYNKVETVKLNLEDGQLSVSADSPVASLAVYDIAGRQLAQARGARVSLNQSRGVALVKVRLCNGASVTRKILFN